MTPECPYCGGLGTIEQDAICYECGHMTITRTCPVCAGAQSVRCAARCGRWAEEMQRDRPYCAACAEEVSP